MTEARRHTIATGNARPVFPGALFLLAIAVGTLAPTRPASGHPAHAKPVNYPYVVGFERFHSSLDDDDYLAEGGFILLNELNCVACHEPPRALAEQLSGVEGTDLRGVAGRLNHLDLEIMIRNPRFVKRDTVMPSLFAGPDRDLDEVAALKHYLATLAREIPDYPRGEIEAGRELYHRIGCAACHAPEAGYRPPGIPENAEIELAGLPSVPMNLADLYDLDSLTHFLLEPNEHRPSGRMPDFRLSVGEAADLAAYLKAGPDLVLPENLTEALTESRPFFLDEDLAKRGRELFATKNCTACHVVPGEKKLSPTRARSLSELDPAAKGGCFSARPAGGAVPFYGLDEVQKRAISAALERLDQREELDEEGAIDWRMKSLNCYACHERGGVGGAETAREVYFGFGSEAAVALGRFGHLPPALDRVGVKLTGDWLERVLLGRKGGGLVRRYQAARMPLYRDEKVRPLLRGFPRVDRWEEESPFPKARPGGGSLDGTSFAALMEREECSRCHEIPGGERPEIPGIPLALAPDRLQRDYFERLLHDPQSLLPGTPMPKPFANEDDAAATIRRVWRYLEESR